MTTGDEIRTARQRAGLTQQELASRIGVSMRTIGNWERGETVPQRHAARIADVLGGHLTSAPKSTIEDYSDAALLAEIARRFDLTRSHRERTIRDPAPSDHDLPLADRPEPDGSTTRPEAWTLAAMAGQSDLERQDREADARGEESQDHGGEEPA